MAVGLGPPAEVLRKELDDHLSCSVCLDRYTDPRTLSCQHSFCKSCIDQLPRELGDVVKCPICREPAKLSEKGASALPKVFVINNILELLKKTHHPECSKHKKEKRFFCEVCEELMCFNCSRNYPHDEHPRDIVEAHEVLDKHLQQIRSCLQPVNIKIASVKDLLARFHDTERKIQEQGEAVKKEIEQTVQQQLENLQELIQRSKQVLIDRVETATRRKLELHSMEQEELETVLIQLTSCKEFIEDKLSSQSHDRYQIQAAKKELVQCIKDAHSEVKVSELQPGQRADTEYVKCKSISPPDVGSIKSTLNYQSVRGLFSVDIPNCVLQRVTTEVSLTSSLSLSAKLVQCKVKSISNNAEATSYEVRQVTEGHFKVLLNLEEPGPHELSVCIGEANAHIHGSPFKFSVMSIAEWRGQQNMKVLALDLKYPCGLAVTDDGKHVVVTEWQGHCVSVFSTATAQELLKFGQHGACPGEFKKPYEVKVSHDNHIYVKDEQYVQKFTLNGLLINRIDNFKFDRGMAVLPCGSVLANVKLPHSTSKRMIKITSEFEDIGIFDFTFEPLDIIVDNKGTIYILTSNKIHTYTLEGKYVGSFGSGFLKTCDRFCIDSNIIYVTDGKEVKIFSTNGYQYLGSFGSHHKLRGIGISKITGDLFICKASGEVLVYNSPEHKKN